MRSLGALPQERQLYSEILRRLESGESLVRATLVQAWGSTPREVGAKMLVFGDGSLQGTVGGGCGEAEVWEAACQTLADGHWRRVEVDLTEDESSDSGKVCGGRFEVFLELWRPSPDLVARLKEALEAEQEGLWVTYLGPQPSRTWKKQPATPPSPRPDWSIGESRWTHRDVHPVMWSAVYPAARPCLMVEEGHEYFLDPLCAAMELIIAGAGHIARPLSRMASLCGYRVVVVDDRPEFARDCDFPEAQVHCRDFSEFFANHSLHPLTHVVLVTRGHKHDQDCLRSLATRRPWPSYLGMIGSRRRTRAVLHELLQEGICEEFLTGVYAPVGLDIGALSPEEIGVSILAEMILLRRGGKGGSLRLSREEV